MTKKPSKPAAAPVPAAPPPAPEPTPAPPTPAPKKARKRPPATPAPTPDPIPEVALAPKKRRKKIERDLPPGFEREFSEGKHKGKLRCTRAVKEDDPTRGINPATNRPFRRNSNRQCGNRAAEGYKVCSRHGVAPKKRVAEGKVEDSRAAGIRAQWPGFDRLGPDVRAAADSYASAGPDVLGDLGQVLILAHVQLETVMLVQREALGIYKAATAGDKDSTTNEPGDAIVALDRVSNIASRAGNQIETVMKVIDTMTKKNAANEGVITPSQFLFTLNQMQERVRQLAADPSVPRAEIPDRLVDWLHAFVSGQAAPAGTA